MPSRPKTPVAKIPVAMTIAGSDPGGGAGLQADLKTFAAFQVYGFSAVTAIIAQNSSRV
ncbi:MAG TPA: bifunctional hydroxymethylpyrimidine kinase/phosphomethylpyrimidine kinase, partial [Candidatus Binataceae bacterium]|nr:bifunctional hydroxymethylpyrimidine kinase/phosphomethylpyrimidine kinase [Candidatus Binataceae bacterium]